MNETAMELPSYGIVRRALRDVTERLSCEIDAPRTEAPLWTPFEWRIARAVAAMHGISTLLATRLMWRGPADWHEFLELQRARSIERERGIDATLARLDDSLRATGVGCVGLKGTALRRLGIYLPGERPMGDVDVLARHSDAARVSQAICAAGYVHVVDKDRETIFEPAVKAIEVGFGEHIANPLKVELHLRVAEPLPLGEVNITAGLFPEALAPGIDGYRDVGALMQHLLLHAAGNICVHALRQIQLHDIALLSRELTAAHWHRLFAPGRAGCWWMLPALDLAARYYAGSVPPFALESARTYCPPLLRVVSERASLTKISWSNLRISAFPGIAWSRSPFEAARFMRSRVLPAKSMLDELAFSYRTIPSLRQQRWYGEKHAVRIARWVFTRPPRVQTMTSVRAAVTGDVA